MAGYDSGIAGGILSYKTFEDDFRYTSAHESKVSSLTVGLEQLGSFVASLFAYYLTDKFGRKWVIIGSTAVFCIGVIIQVINTHSLGAWYAGRIIAGIGMGGQSVVVPMYSAEMTPKEIRGRCGSFYQWLYTWGILAAYWIDYVRVLDSRYARLLTDIETHRASQRVQVYRKHHANGRSPWVSSWSREESW